MAKKITTKLAKVNKDSNTKAVSTAVVAKSLHSKSKPLIKKLKTFKIKTAQDYEKAFQLTKELKERGKEATKQLNGSVDPIREIKAKADQSIKAAGLLFKPFFEEIVEVDCAVKAEMLKFHNKNDGKKKQLAESFEAGDTTSTSFARKSAKLEVTKGKKMVWTAVEKDVSKTPRAYLVPDVDKIEQDLKESKKVAGWSWEQVAQIAI